MLCYFLIRFTPFLTGLSVVFETLRKKIRNMQKSIKKSSMQFVKNNYAHLCFMHKIKFVFFHIIDKIT